MGLRFLLLLLAIVGVALIARHLLGSARSHPAALAEGRRVAGTLRHDVEQLVAGARAAVEEMVRRGLSIGNNVVIMI